MEEAGLKALGVALGALDFQSAAAGAAAPRISPESRDKGEVDVIGRAVLGKDREGLLGEARPEGSGAATGVDGALSAGRTRYSRLVPPEAAVAPEGWVDLKFRFLPETILWTIQRAATASRTACSPMLINSMLAPFVFQRRLGGFEDGTDAPGSGGAPELEE
jgi:hypothetical protein